VRCGTPVGNNPYCSACGAPASPQSGYYGGFNNAQPGATYGSWPPGQPWQRSSMAPPPYEQNAVADPGNGLSIAGIICGAIAFLFFPILLGPAGLILGGIGLSRRESKAPIAMVVSGCGLVVGMILGVIVSRATYGI
jgi:hypothetical protein